MMFSDLYLSQSLIIDSLNILFMNSHEYRIKNAYICISEKFEHMANN